MIIIKIGGGKSINIPGIVKDLSDIKEKFIIVHGANAKRDEILNDLGLKKRILTSVKGYSSVFSDKNTIDVILMSYAGLVNKRIVELCQQNNINAIGLSGVDGKSIEGKRNQGIRIKEGSKIKIVRDFSGKPHKINVGLLNLLLQNNYTPVLCIPILDEKNCAINSENDDIVNILQKDLHANKIISLIEAPGYLDNKDLEHSLVKEMKKEELTIRENQVEGRMKRKMLSLRKLFEHGATQVIISDGRVDNPIKNALEGAGTLIK